MDVPPPAEPLLSPCAAKDILGELDFLGLANGECLASAAKDSVDCPATGVKDCGCPATTAKDDDCLATGATSYGSYQKTLHVFFLSVSYLQSTLTNSYRK